jgi:uncharacterized protein YjbI with pentapeptide repeats
VHELLHPPIDPTELKADCTRCFGLCCVIPAFSASADFAIDKPAGQPCPNLRADFRCGIHHRLRPSGFVGCTVYDCFGAGQKVSQVTFDGPDWPRMAAVFPVMRQLHELMWYLTQALDLPAARPVHPELGRALGEVERLTRQPADALAGLDPAPLWRRVNELLLRASALARAVDDGAVGRRRPLDRRGADLVGADLRRTELRRASLRGALLVGANLTRVDLALADLTGADLRGARLDGADLSRSLFVTQSQLEAANGSPETKLPRRLARPAHWAHG